ncbi:MAG: endonuclease/exonuclease/phosphatase family protein [Candidatus Cryptobacteroides sp.]
MKRFFLTALCILLAFNMNAQKAQQNFVIGFYNLENLFDIYDDPVKNDAEYLPEGKNKWTQAKYEKKLKNMAHVIADMAKNNGRYHTILGVSEIENRLVLEDLVSQEEIADANFQIVHYDSPDRRGVDVALLYKPDQFTYLDSESIPFTFEGSEIDFSDTDTDYFRTRDILMVHGLIAGEDFAFYVMHLPSRVGGKGGNLRSRGAEIAYAHARVMEEKYPGIKIVMMGDMNDDPFDESMVTYLHGKESVEEMQAEDFYNPYLSMIKAGYGSLCYQGTWCIYDQELVNYNLAVAPQGGLKIQPVTKNRGSWYDGVVYKRPYLTTQKGQYKGYPFRTFSNGAFVGGYSDHYPTFIVIGK